jgi:hypothetical protein
MIGVKINKYYSVCVNLLKLSYHSGIPIHIIIKCLTKNLPKENYEVNTSVHIFFEYVSIHR